MTEIFTLRKNPYKIRSIRLFGSENPRSVRFGVDATAFRASQLRQKVPICTQCTQSRIYIIYMIVIFFKF